MDWQGLLPQLSDPRIAFGCCALSFGCSPTGEATTLHELPPEEPWSGPMRAVETQACLFRLSGETGKGNPDRMWELARPLQTGRFFLVYPGEEIVFENLELVLRQALVSRAPDPARRPPRGST